MGNDIKRCIMIFPEFENISIINEIRETYDPFVNNVRPHITLVFPFESNIKERKLREWMNEALKCVKSFHVELEGVIKISSDSSLYLCLEVKKGKEEIREIHSRLYDGILKAYKPQWLNHIEFIPHMTIGKFSSEEELNIAYGKVGNMKEKFFSKVDKVSAEIVVENDSSIREIEIDLQQ
jgi:2'-5' RNA ligase